MTTPKNALYKQQQVRYRERESMATLLVPTLPTRINRLNPQERAEVSQLIRAMKLRKIIRRTLAEAFWAKQQEADATHRFKSEYDRCETFFTEG